MNEIKKIILVGLAMVILFAGVGAYAYVFPKHGKTAQPIQLEKQTIQAPYNTGNGACYGSATCTININIGLGDTVFVAVTQSATVTDNGLNSYSFLSLSSLSSLYIYDTVATSGATQVFVTGSFVEEAVAVSYNGVGFIGRMGDSWSFNGGHQYFSAGVVQQSLNETIVAFLYGGTPYTLSSQPTATTNDRAHIQYSILNELVAADSSQYDLISHEYTAITMNWGYSLTSHDGFAIGLIPKYTNAFIDSAVVSNQPGSTYTISAPSTYQKVGDLYVIYIELTAYYHVVSISNGGDTFTNVSFKGGAGIAYGYNYIFTAVLGSLSRETVTVTVSPSGPYNGLALEIFRGSTNVVGHSFNFAAPLTHTYDFNYTMQGNDNMLATGFLSIGYATNSPQPYKGLMWVGSFGGDNTILVYGTGWNSTHTAVNAEWGMTNGNVAIGELFGVEIGSANVPYIVTTHTATGVEFYNATLRGSFDSWGTQPEVSMLEGFCYGDNPTNPCAIGGYTLSNNVSVGSTSVLNSFSLNTITYGLLSGAKTYYFLAWVEVQSTGHNYTQGSILSFTTNTNPTVTTQPKTDTPGQSNLTWARLNGHITRLGTHTGYATNLTAVGFIWGHGSYNQNTSLFASYNTLTDFHYDISNLTPGYYYCYKAYAEWNNGGAVYGGYYLASSQCFYTYVVRPTIQTNSVAFINDNDAGLSGTILTIGTPATEEYGFQISDNIGFLSGPGHYFVNYTVGNTTVPLTYIYQAFNLTNSTKYYYRAWVIQYNYMIFGGIQNFTTSNNAQFTKAFVASFGGGVYLIAFVTLVILFFIGIFWIRRRRGMVG